MENKQPPEEKHQVENKRKKQVEKKQTSRGEGKRRQCGEGKGGEEKVIETPPLIPPFGGERRKTRGERQVEKETRRRGEYIKTASGE